MDSNADFLLAQQWLACLTEHPSGTAPAELPLPEHWIDAVATLVGLALAADKRIQIVVPDDETLPELSNALDIELRPLCLVLPEAEFTTRIALRATLTLLKSRLARRADAHPLWETQRQHIESLAGSWQDALTWGQSESTAQWPDDIAHLFPARVLPASHALAFATPDDLHVLIAPERMPPEWCEPLTSTSHVLRLRATQRGASRRQLVRFDEEARQRFELDLLNREVAELELELATAQAEVADFSQRYYTAVGTLLAELDVLHAELARQAATRQPDDLSLQQAAHQSHAQAERSQQEQKRFEDIPRKVEAKPFTPSRDLKKLYRQVAQKIHPDRADNETDRQWRTQLMVEATLAYRNEDEVALHEVLAAWQNGSQPDNEAMSVNSLAQQVHRMKLRLGGIQTELDRLLGSRLYELLIANRLADRQGRDLLQEMATQISLQIQAAKKQLVTSDGEPPCSVASS